MPISIVFASVDRRSRKDFYKDVAASVAWSSSERIFVAQIGYATYVGGDAWEWMLYANRYMCVGMPALIVLVAVVLVARSSTTTRRASAARSSRSASRSASSSAALVLVALNLYAKKFPEQGIAATIVVQQDRRSRSGGAFVFLGFLLRLRDCARASPKASARCGAGFGSQTHRRRGRARR